MVLTQEGVALLNYCLRANELEGATLSCILNSGVSHNTIIRFCGPTSFISGRAVPQLAQHLKLHPFLNVQFAINDQSDRIEILKQGKADLVALHPHQVPNEVDSKLVKPDEYILLGHPSWKNRSLKEIISEERLFAFHEDDQTSLNYLKTFNLFKYLKRPRLFVNENLALSKMLRAGIGFGILSKEIAMPFIQDRQLMVMNEGRSLKDPIALAWYPRPNMPGYFKDILKLIK